MSCDALATPGATTNAAPAAASATAARRSRSRPPKPVGRRECIRPRRRTLPAHSPGPPVAPDGRRLPSRPEGAVGVPRRRPSATRRVEELEAWIAGMRADGLASSTIARRVSAVRTYFRHLVLIGARTENPAASTPATAPPAHATARALARRDRAAHRRRDRGRRRGRCAIVRSSSSCTAPGSVSPRPSGSRRAASRSRSASSACSARAARSGSSRSGDRPPRPCAATSRSADPHLDRRYRPELFLNAPRRRAHARRRDS